VDIEQGANGTSTISIAFRSGSRETISLSATGQPAGATVSFSPSSVTVDDSYERSTSATMTVNVGASTASGTYPITVRGTGVGAAHTTTLTLKVLIPAKVVVLKSGASRRGSCLTCTVYSSWGAVLQNVSPDEDALDVTVKYNWLNTGGGVVIGLSAFYPVIPAGATYYAGDAGLPWSFEVAPSRIEITAVTIGWHQKKTPPGLPPVENVRTSEDASGPHVLGDFVNPYLWTIGSPALSAVCFDAAGNVIGGGSVRPNVAIAPSGRASFNVPISGLNASQIASTQVSVAGSVHG
jgi:hypothetical protein